MPTGFGIVGTGMIADFHAKAIGDIRGAKLVGCFNRTMSKAETFAAEHGCQAYDTLDAMLENPEIDIVTICTPSGAHLEPAVAAAKAGKHLLIEKPLEITLKRCDRIIDACEKAGVYLGTIFPSRFSPANIALKEAVDAGALRQTDRWRYLRQMVAVAGVLRQRRMARHLGPRRRGSLHEPGHPQRRPAVLADGRCRRSLRNHRYACP